MEADIVVVWLVILIITAFYTAIVCGVIALITLFVWIVFQLKEEIRIVDSMDDEKQKRK